MALYNLTGVGDVMSHDVTDTVPLLAEKLRVNVLLFVVVVVSLLFYVHDKHLRSCQDGQLT